jgi:DNA-binding beta-propeller fold protein YncE
MTRALSALPVIACAVFAQYPDTFLGSLAVGNGPLDICISPDGDRAYTAVGFGFVTVIDIEGYSQFSLGGLVNIDGEPSAVQCDAAGEMLYVADAGGSQVHVVNTASLEVEYSFPVQPAPVDMILAAGAGRIFLSHSSGMVTVIDTATGYPDGFFWAGQALNGLAVSPCGSFVYAPDNGSPYETVITAGTGSVNRVISGMDSRSAAVSSDGSRLFLSSTAWNAIGVMDALELVIETMITCEGTAPVNMGVLPGSQWLYGAHPTENKLTVYHTGDLTLQGTVDVPGQPGNIAVHPDGERLFVVCGDNKVRIYGYDPAGIETAGTGFSLSPSHSPAAAPSVSVTAGEPGAVTLRGYDLSGRTVWSATAVLARGESREFTVSAGVAGVLLVTAETPEGTLSARVVVLER